MTTQQQLDEINTAITAILTGAQEYNVGTRKVRKADLNFLTVERQRLEQKLQGELYNPVAVVRFSTR